MADQAYLIVVTPLSEEEGGGFLAHVPDLPGCMGDGETAPAAIENVLSAIGEWTDETLAAGQELPAPGSFAAQFRDDWDNLRKLVRVQKKAIQKHEALSQSQNRVIEELQSELKSSKDLIAELTNQLDAGDLEEAGEEQFLSVWARIPKQPIGIVAQISKGRRLVHNHD